MEELFSRDQYQRRGSESAGTDAPLAERMRPRSLEEFEGQGHLLGEGSPLDAVVGSAAELPSLVLWGPPGSGKTTLARLLAQRAGLRFVPMSAVLSGVRDLREQVAAADDARRGGTRTALFIDEIHRFNKAQQDALLPYVERGTIVLIGATTENPSFEVISALRSRCRVFTLRALDDEDIARIVRRALTDEERGLGGRGLSIDDRALGLLQRLSEGDARRALTILDNAAGRIEGEGRGLDRDAIAAAVDTRLPDYDKGGEAHYDVISAFIKSVRGSDPDAAVYYLARMLEAGEDPRFITRRIIILASEDIGNADPQALPLAVAAAEAFDRVGLPEGRLILSQAVTYLASTAKSNASMKAIGAATESVREWGALPVPLHLRNAPTQLLREQGYAKGYEYPHDHPGHFVEAQYLPDRLHGRARYYEPTDQGEESRLRDRLRRLWSRARER